MNEKSNKDKAAKRKIPRLNSNTGCRYTCTTMPPIKGIIILRKGASFQIGTGLKDITGS
jgi:hypothetical protein